MKNKLKNRVNKVSTAIMTAIMSLMITVPVYAEPSIEDLPLYKGTMNLIAALTGGITAIAAAVGVFFCVKAGIAWHTANEQEKPGKLKALIGTVISAVVIVAIPGALTWILLFY